MKVCKECNVEKEEDAFRSGRGNCRDCERSLARKKNLTKEEVLELHLKLKGEGITTKPCTKCKKVLPFSEFSIAGTKKYGLASSCISCNTAAYIAKRDGKLTQKPTPITEDGVKHCTGCDTDKPYNAFHANVMSKDGRNTRCIECVRNYRQNAPEEVKQKARDSMSSRYHNLSQVDKDKLASDKKEQRNLETPEERKIRTAKARALYHNQTEEQRKGNLEAKHLRFSLQSESQVEYRKIQNKATDAVKVAIRANKLFRPKRCSNPLCESGGAVEGHHWSYEEKHWLDVVWLCTPCHSDIHKYLRGQLDAKELVIDCSKHSTLSVVDMGIGNIRLINTDKSILTRLILINLTLLEHFDFLQLHTLKTVVVDTCTEFKSTDIPYDCPHVNLRHCFNLTKVEGINPDNKLTLVNCTNVVGELPSNVKVLKVNPKFLNRGS